MDVAREIPQSPFNTQSQVLLRFLQSPNASTFLYQHQIESVLKAKHQLDDPRQPSIALVVLPTGCGKTGVAVLAAYALNASRVLVITPSIKISKQVHEAFCGNCEQKTCKPTCFLTKRRVITSEQELAVLPSSGSFVRESRQIKARLRDNLMVANAHKIGGRSSVAIETIPADHFDLVIVDEAHHYPAPTWKLLVDHFKRSKRLFLTATPEHKGKPILPYQPCYSLPRKQAVDRGIIRDIDYDEEIEPLDPNGNADRIVQAIIDGGNGNEDKAYIYACLSVAKKVENYLDEHDRLDPSVKHQAMVLTQTRKDLNDAATFRDVYNQLYPGNKFYPTKCQYYVTGTERGVLEGYEGGKIRTLIVIGRLIEGFDRKEISVVAIARNVAKDSRVLFAQFVGRAVRKDRRDDPVTAMIVSHPRFKQRVNFDQFDKIAEEENVDEDD